MTDTPPLAGQVVVVAGTLSRLGRRQLAALVERQAGRVQTAVTRDTTMLVLGADLAIPGTDASDPPASAAPSTPRAPSRSAPARPAPARPGPARPAPITSRSAAAESTPDARRIADAQRLNARYPGRVRILSEREFFDLAGIPPAAGPDISHAKGGAAARVREIAPTPADITAAAVATAAVGADEDESTALYSSRALRGLYPALRDDHLRYLEHWGLVRPVRRTRQERFYRFADLAVIRQASAELARGHAFRAVLRGLVAEREGQLALDFQPPTGDAQPAKVIALTPRARQIAQGTAGAATRRPDPDAQTLDLAARYFAEGSELDCGDEAQQEAAMAAYRHAVMLDPGMVAALVNLANLYYARDAIVEAEALYEKALALDDGCFEAHFNLGNVHHDTGRFEEAVRRYEQALGIDSSYADAHFYLAVALEKLGRSADARPHWQSYQRLAPHGEWVELAKEFSSQG